MKCLRAPSRISDAISLQRTAYKPIRLFTTAHRPPIPRPALRLSPSNPRSLLLTRRTHPFTRHESSTSSPETLKKTPLYDLHVAHGAKMVPFAGFSMPVQYSNLSLIESHRWTRNHCSLFDVSHMVQHNFRGRSVSPFLEKITPIEVGGLKDMSSGLSVLLNEKGGIVDDTIITKFGESSFYVVTNAGCREKDLKYFEEQLKNVNSSEVDWNVLDIFALLALQGPKSEEVLSSILADGSESLKTLLFGQCRFVKLKLPGERLTTNNVLVSRGGYTGEDGFEISIPQDEAAAIAESLIKHPEVELAGLGARDSLRLEAGMCLYGHDLDENTTPVEAGLSWVIGKERKEKGGFNGDSVILPQLAPKSKGGAGVERRRIGLIVKGAPAREGAEIVSLEGEGIGKVTSGCPSPTLGQNIAMGYIKDGFHKSGTDVEVVVRGKNRKAKVTKMPFVPTKYWRGNV